MNHNALTFDVGNPMQQQVLLLCSLSLDRCASQQQQPIQVRPWERGQVTVGATL